MLKVNVGCGNRKIHGFTNVDIRPDVSPDLICDVSNISSKVMNADLVYACHVLEHFPQKPSAFCKTTWHDVLVDWHRALKQGGKVRISVPDMQTACERYLKTGSLDEVNAFFFGGQKYDFDFHYCGWDFLTLKRALEEIGFTDVCRYDWKRTEHFYVDDYSQAYLPHMDKANGLLMSLNVEATKQ